MKSKVWRWFLFGFVFGAFAVGLLWTGMEIERTRWERGPSAVEEISQQIELPDTLRDEHVSQELPEVHEVGRRTEITEAIRKASPAVVGITVTKTRTVRQRSPMADDPFYQRFFRFFPQRIYERQIENYGSGFIIAPDGYVVTNEHVVNDADSIIVALNDGRTFVAEVLGTDYDTDIALLKVNGKDLPWLRVADEEDLLVGEWVMSIGNPFGLFKVNDQPSVSVGVVSALGRTFNRQEDGRQYTDMIQTDAAINPGNSGGPLINTESVVIGVNTFIFTGGDGSTGSIGIGFAIPAPTVLHVVDNLRARAEIDDAVWTGMVIDNLNWPVANSLRYPSLAGVIVMSIEPDGPADDAGMLPGDIIMAVNGVKIASIRSLDRYFKNHDLRVGDVLDFEIFRDGDSEVVHMQLVEVPQS
ncbi:trypsin-like peptidase domain-containing protein [bacterium]|nr:trypsin-like peptidase domain-containing protein [bacterium]